MASLFGLMAGILFAVGLVAGSLAMRRLSLGAAYGWGQVAGLVVLLVAVSVAGAPLLPGWNSATLALVASGLVAGLLGRMFALSGAHRLGPAVSGTVQAGTYATSASVLAVLLLHQHVSVSRAFGIAATLIGLYVAVAARAAPDGTLGPSDSVGHRSALLDMPQALLVPAMAGLCYGFAEQLRAYGVGSILPPVTSALTVAASTTVLWGLLLLWRAGASWGRARPLGGALSAVGGPPAGLGMARLFACIAGLTYVGAILALLAGLQVGDVAQVSPVAATQPLWLVLISGLIAHERKRLDGRLLAGATIVVIGAAWIGTH
jgi:drug/metabolite transporter (DMT)-like permease